MQASSLGTPEAYNLPAAVNAAQAFVSFIRQRLTLAETAFRCLVELRAWQPCEKTGERHETSRSLGGRHGLERVQGDAVLDTECPGGGGPPGGEMADGAEGRGDVLGERADICALAAANADLHDRALELQKLELGDSHAPRLSYDGFPLARELIERDAVALQCR